MLIKGILFDLYGTLLISKKDLCMQALVQLKPRWHDLVKRSCCKLEIHINFPDVIINSFLYALLFHCQTNNIKVDVNYLGNNYATFYLRLHIIVLIMILGKFILSPPVLKLTYFFIRDKFSYQN